MNTAVKQEKRKEAKVISLNEQTAELKIFIGATWLLAKSAFWNEDFFQKRETDAFCKLIESHFEKAENKKTKFKELAERICLAKRYVTRSPERYVPRPEEWLNINYKSGLAGTENWFSKIREQRKTVPHFYNGTAILAEGVLEFIQKPEQATVLKYRKKLIEHKQFDLLQIFQNTIINLLF